MKASKRVFFSFEDYLQLVDYTGRCFRDDKKGAKPNHLPAILQRLSIDRETWLLNSTQFEAVYHTHFRQRFKRRTKAA